MIDGTTEPDYVVGAPVVELDGVGAGRCQRPAYHRQQYRCQGLVINGFGQPAGSTSGVGILLENSTGHLIEGNFIGTDVTGMLARPNRFNGILMSDADIVDRRWDDAGFAERHLGERFGRPPHDRWLEPERRLRQLHRSESARNGGDWQRPLWHLPFVDWHDPERYWRRICRGKNVISGNGGDGIQVHTGSSDNQIVGNYVGTDVTGNVDLGNNGRGVYIGSGSNNVIGDVNGNGNLISGNSVGIQVDSGSKVQIVNNLVGVNAAGTGALGNQQQGISSRTPPPPPSG